MSFRVSRKRSLRSLSFAVMAHSLWGLAEYRTCLSCQRHPTSNVPAISKGKPPARYFCNEAAEGVDPALSMTETHDFCGHFTPLSYASRKVGASDTGEIYHERLCITRLDRARRPS